MCFLQLIQLESPLQFLLVAANATKNPEHVPAGAHDIDVTMTRSSFTDLKLDLPIKKLSCKLIKASLVTRFSSTGLL
jgi:hypothetical protein